jgi:hypothetical protein
MNRSAPITLAPRLRLQMSAVACLALAPLAHADEAPPADIASGSGITLQVTLSRDPPDPPPGYDLCGPAASLTAYTGETVRWCYEVTNNTAQSLTRHDVSSSQFGNLISAFPFTLAPGESAFLTRTEPAVISRVESAVWTAYNPGPDDIHSDSGSGSLTVLPGVELTITLSVDPLVLPPNYDHCGSATGLPVPPGRNVRWCYEITNHSSIPRTRHTLRSERLGTLLTDFPFSLEPEASAFLTRVESMNESGLSESATWTAFRPGPVNVSSDQATAQALSATGIFTDGFE